MKKKITLREIASIAKVSPATASIVLNDKKNQGISDKTWNKVKKIAQKFNYSGNNKRRRLDKRKFIFFMEEISYCLLYTSPSPRDGLLSRMPSSA